MAKMSSRDLVNMLTDIFDRFDQNHHEIENEFKIKLKRSLSRSELKDLTSEECSELIEAVNKALAVVESKSHTLYSVKDSLKQAKIDALEVKLKYCTCQEVHLREEHKRSNNKDGKQCIDSGISNPSSTDSRVISSIGDAPVVQPSDAPDEK